MKETNDTTATSRMIKAAIDGGWKYVYSLYIKKEMIVFVDHAHGGYNKEMTIQEALLDPTFWQCAGKSFSVWLEKASVYNENVAWREQWHSFIDHLADGHDINSALELILE